MVWSGKLRPVPLWIAKNVPLATANLRRTKSLATHATKEPFLLRVGHGVLFALRVGQPPNFLETAPVQCAHLDTKQRQAVQCAMYVCPDMLRLLSPMHVHHVHWVNIKTLRELLFAGIAIPTIDFTKIQKMRPFASSAQVVLLS